MGEAPGAYLGKVASGVGTSSQLTPLRVIVATLIQADEIAIRAQVRCPVSDQPLGAHGPPIKLLVDGRPLFVCCQGCVSKVQENPDRYLAGVGSGRIAPAPRDWSISGSECATCSASGRPDNTGCSGPACESRFSR